MSFLRSLFKPTAAAAAAAAFVVVSVSIVLARSCVNIGQVVEIDLSCLLTVKPNSVVLDRIYLVYSQECAFEVIRSVCLCVCLCLQFDSSTVT